MRRKRGWLPETSSGKQKHRHTPSNNQTQRRWRQTPKAVKDGLDRSNSFTDSSCHPAFGSLQVRGEIQPEWNEIRVFPLIRMGPKFRKNWFHSRTKNPLISVKQNKVYYLEPPENPSSDQYHKKALVGRPYLTGSSDMQLTRGGDCVSQAVFQVLYGRYRALFPIRCANSG